MNPRLLLKLLISDFLWRPARVVLAALAVVAAACVVVWVVSGYDALVQGFDDNAEKYLGQTDLVLINVGPGKIAPDFLTDLQNDTGVAHISKSFQSRVGIENPKDPDRWELFSGAPVNGAPPPPVSPPLVGTDAVEAPYELVSGRWIDPQSDKVEGVLSQGTATRSKVNLGDEVVVTSQANQVCVTIVGIIEQPQIRVRLGGGGHPARPTPSTPQRVTKTNHPNAPPMGKAGSPRGHAANPSTGPTPSQTSRPAPRRGPGGAGPITSGLFVPIALANRINGYDSSPSVINVDLKEGVSVEDFRKTWASRFTAASLQVIDGEDIRSRMSDPSSHSGKRAQAYSATGMALLAAVFIIFTTLSMGVSERSRELAVLRSVSLTRFQVAGLILAESLFLAAIGWAGGLLAGYGLLTLASQAQPDLFPTGAELGWWCVGLAGVAAFGGALIAAIIPAWRATRVSPLDAMSAPRPGAVSRWPWLAAGCGLVLLVINPVLIFIVDLPDSAKISAYAGVGYPSMVIGCLLLAPLGVLAVEKFLGPIVARIMWLDPRLLASQLSGNLWRTLGTTVALTVGLGLYIATQTWGYSMLEPYYPGKWLPDLLVAFQPSGLPDDEHADVSQVPGVRPEMCLPLAVEQPRLAVDLTHSQERISATRQDNVVVFGLDPERGFGGDTPFLDIRFVDGKREEAIAKMKSGRYCLIPDHFADITGLGIGGKVPFQIPSAPDAAPVEYTVAGVVSIPGWHWVTKFSGVRRNYVRTAAIIFTPYTQTRQDFRLDRITFFWLNAQPGANFEDMGRSFQAIADRHAGETFSSHAAGPAIAYRPTVKMTTTKAVRDGVDRRAEGMIWGMSQLPLVTLAVTAIGVVGTVAASVRVRRWELGVLRALGVTRWGLFRLILAEAILIAVVACVLSLGFGILAGWCGVGMASYSGFFGGMDTRLILSWRHIGLGLGATLGLCLLAGLWPAIRAGLQEPLALLRAGRASM
ncbi:MAG: FtsX-like permease family protein [Bacteroidales bacterium]|nr:FtsX-like permease family protein [Bacteroidales bacterium]